MNILIAEDDATSRRMLEATLISWGYEVAVMLDGEQAWEKLQAEDAPSLAILDIMMPGMDGLEICRRIRQRSVSIPPYIILLTSMRNKEDVVFGIRAGANDYLTKPFHYDELKVRIGVGMQMIELQRALTQRVKELEEALSQVKQLQGIVPLCSYCKMIRDDKNYWQQVESYIAEHTEAQFSHSVCPDCYIKVVEPQLDKIKQSKRNENWE